MTEENMNVLKVIDSAIDNAITLTDLIAGNEITPEDKPRPLKEVLEQHFTQDSPTWEDMAVIAETIRFLQRREGGDRLAAQVVHWLAQQQEVRRHWSNNE